MQLSLKLVESTSQIADLIMGEIGAVLNGVLSSSAKSIEGSIRALFVAAITGCDEWQSLKSGQLRAEFGLPDDVDSRLSAILDIWVDQIIVDYKPVTGKTVLKGGIILNMLKTDWLDVISSDAANIITRVGQVLPWLEWLLIFGDKIVVREFEVVMKGGPTSRSGMALMVKKSTGRWRVPPEFAGTTNNNFVTKLLDKIADQISDMIEIEIEKRL